MTSPPRVALVHDWLLSMRGGERVLEVLCELFPQAPIYTLFYYPGTTSAVIESHQIHHSFLQKLPGVHRYYRYTYPLMPVAIETFDLSAFDLVISTSSRVAKGVLTGAHTCHISYIHTPMRETWELSQEYFGAGQMSWWKRLVIPPQLSVIRVWDYLSSYRADYMIANSENVRRRIEHVYHRDATVLYPPVNLNQYQPTNEKEDYYLMVGSFEPNKRVHLAVEAFTNLGRPLKIVSGSGRGHEKVMKHAGPTIEYLGWQDDAAVSELFAKAKGFVFPGVDDFGITPLEAQASGTPVIAFGQGGALETVIDGETGVFFDTPTADSLYEAVLRFEKMTWDIDTLVNNAARFGKERFRREVDEFVWDKYEEWKTENVHLSSANYQLPISNDQSNNNNQFLN